MMKMKTKEKKTTTNVNQNQVYYNTDQIDTYNAHYNFVFGERSNGKTTAILKKMLTRNWEFGETGVILRRYDQDVKSAQMTLMFQGLEELNFIEELTDGEWTHVKLYRKAFYYARMIDGKEERNDVPFAFTRSLAGVEHDKGSTIAKLGTILFDEFIALGNYLPDEVGKFFQTISTLVRSRDNIKVFLVGNSVTWNTPYMKAFGLDALNTMKPGTHTSVNITRKDELGIEKTLVVALEYCKDSSKYGGKPSDVYFQVDHAAAKMITTGAFAIVDYPKCPHKFGNGNKKATYWFFTDNAILRGRLLVVGYDTFVFIETVTREMYDSKRNERRDAVYSLNSSSHYRHYTCPLHSYKTVDTKYLAEAIATNKVFFDNNNTGENFRYFCVSSDQHSVVNLGK